MAAGALALPAGGGAGGGGALCHPAVVVLKDYLRRRLTERLAGQLGLAVNIGSLSLDWVDGVSIRDVTIASPEGYSPTPMVRIDRIAADLSPITYLVTGRLHRLEAHGLHLSVESDGAGRWNVAALAALSAEPVASRVSIRGALATFQTSRQEDLLSLAVSELDLQVSASRPMVRISMSAMLTQEDQPAPIRFHLTEGDGEETVAVATLEFSNLHLDRLPLRTLLPDLPLRQCTGQAEGWAELRIDNQGMINRCNADVSVRTWRSSRWKDRDCRRWTRLGWPCGRRWTRSPGACGSAGWTCGCPERSWWGMGSSPPS